MDLLDQKAFDLISSLNSIDQDTEFLINNATMEKKQSLLKYQKQLDDENEKFDATCKDIKTDNIKALPNCEFSLNEKLNTRKQMLDDLETIKQYKTDIQKLNSEIEALSAETLKFTNDNEKFDDQIRDSLKIYSETFDIHAKVNRVFSDEEKVEIFIYFKKDMKIIKYPVVLHFDKKFEITFIGVSFMKDSGDLLNWYKKVQNFQSLLTNIRKLLMEFIEKCAHKSEDDIYL